MSDNEDMMDEVEQELDLTTQDVVTKYKTAGDIVTNTMQGLVTFASAGKKVLEVCKVGDALVEQQCAKIYKAKNIEKGIAFPTCLSVNNCVCHFSPLSSDAEIELKAGDIVKLDVGVHIDGYIAVGAHTFVVRAEGDATPVTGRAADLINAAYLAAEAAVKLIKPGLTNSGVTKAVAQTATDFGVKPVQGVLMHQMKRFVIDGNAVIIGREELDQKVDEFEFEDAQVYTVDICMTTGEGKPIQRDAKTTIFKRAVDQQYQLKMKASRVALAEINKKFATLPFNLRALQDEKQARMGIVECLRHELVTPYPVLFEKDGELVAHFKYTVLLLPSGTVKITGLPVNLEEFQTDKKPSPEIEAVLRTSASKNKKKKKKKKAAAAAGGAEAMETD